MLNTKIWWHEWALKNEPQKSAVTCKTVQSSPAQPVVWELTNMISKVEKENQPSLLLFFQLENHRYSIPKWLVRYATWIHFQVWLDPLIAIVRSPPLLSFPLLSFLLFLCIYISNAKVGHAERRKSIFSFDTKGNEIRRRITISSTCYLLNTMRWIPFRTVSDMVFCTKYSFFNLYLILLLDRYIQLRQPLPYFIDFTAGVPFSIIKLK